MVGVLGAGPDSHPLWVMPRMDLAQEWPASPAGRGSPACPGLSGGGRRCGRLGCCRGGSHPRPGTGTGRWEHRSWAPGGRAWLLAGLVLGLLLGLSGCGAGDGDESAAPPRPQRDGHSADATDPDQRHADPTTPTSAERPTSPTTRPATSAEALTPTSTPAAAGTPAAAESGGLGTLGWTLLVVLVAGLIIAGWMLGGRARNRPGTPRPVRWSTTPAPPPAPSCRRS